MGEHKLPKIRKTNEMLVRDLMTFSPYGSLSQVFIVEAIRHYAEQIAATPEPTEDGKGIISAVAWHGIARDVVKRLEEHYDTVKNT
jgi:hypothetical protein